MCKQNTFSLSLYLSLSPTCRTLDLLRIVFPDGWYRSMSLRMPRTPTSSASTRRKAVILTKLYLKSSRSKVSISWNRDGQTDRLSTRVGEDPPEGSAWLPPYSSAAESTYESCEEIVVLVVVHLQLQDLKANACNDLSPLSVKYIACCSIESSSGFKLVSTFEQMTKMLESVLKLILQWRCRFNWSFR